MFDNNISKEIVAIPLNSQFPKDKLVWMQTKSGTFTVKSAYNHLRRQTTTVSQNRASSSYQIPRELWQKVWHANIQSKIKFFLCQLCQNVLAIKKIYKGRKSYLMSHVTYAIDS